MGGEAAAMQSFDLVGDIHGCARSLKELLRTLGYSLSDGLYRHPARRLIFVGDFIDRGPQQRQTLEIVKPLIESGLALAVMGNHEFNALAYHTKDGQGGYLREHSPKNQKQHQAFLDQLDSTQRSQALDWFWTLPLFLDLPELRVVHASWVPELVQRARAWGGKLNPDLLRRASGKDREVFEVVDVLLKGWEVDLPQGHSFLDKDGHRRTRMRSRWWSPRPPTFRQAAIQTTDEVPEAVFPEPSVELYGAHDKNVFVGHYWLRGEPELLAPNVCCVDYSVGKGGELVAYRWSGEARLDSNNFVAVPNQDM